MVILHCTPCGKHDFLEGTLHGPQIIGTVKFFCQIFCNLSLHYSYTGIFLILESWNEIQIQIQKAEPNLKNEVRKCFFIRT
jgi:hypothetical protein